jgi:hypothetical protein
MMEKVEQTLIFVVPKNEKFELSAWQKEKEMTKDKGYLNPLNFSGESIKHIENEYIKKDFDPIGWLIESQGYQINELYDAKKVKKSKFLSSLNSELTEYEYYLDGHLTFILGDLEKETNEKITNVKNNIKISPGENIKVGFMDFEKGRKCGLNIKLEKEIIIPKEYMEIISTQQGHKFLPLKEKNKNIVQNSKIEFTEKQPIIKNAIDIEELLKISRIQDKKFEFAEKVSTELNKYFKEKKWETEAVALRDSSIELRIIDTGDMGEVEEVAKKLYKPLEMNCPFETKYFSRGYEINYSNRKGDSLNIIFYGPISSDKIAELAKELNETDKKYIITSLSEKGFNINIEKGKVSIVVPEEKKEYAKNFSVRVSENYKGDIIINNEIFIKNGKINNKKEEELQKSKRNFFR